MCFTCKQAVLPKYIDSTLLKYHTSIKKKKKLQVLNFPPDPRSVKGKPTSESQYAPMAVSSSEEEESLLISISFACIKNKNTALSAGSTLNCFHRSCSDAENGKVCQIEID